MEIATASPRNDKLGRDDKLGVEIATASPRNDKLGRDDKLGVEIALWLAAHGLVPYNQRRKEIAVWRPRMASPQAMVKW